MFAELQLSGELRLKLAGAVLTSACIDQSDMSITLHLTTRAELGEDAPGRAQAAADGRVRLSESRRRGDGGSCPQGLLLPPAHRPMPQPPPAGEKKGGSVKASKILMGKPIKTRPGPMRDLDLKMGNATVAGKVFCL